MVALLHLYTHHSWCTSKEIGVFSEDDLSHSKTQPLNCMVVVSLFRLSVPWPSP